MKSIIHNIVCMVLSVFLLSGLLGISSPASAETATDTISRSAFISLIHQASSERGVLTPPLEGGTDAVTREEAAKIVQTMLHLADAASPFSDIQSFNPYAPAVGAVYKANLMTGTSETDFGYGEVLDPAQAGAVAERISAYLKNRQEQMKPFKAASIQFNPQLNERDNNVDALLQEAEKAFQQGAKLVVAPEMSTTGYTYADRDAIKPYVDTIPGKTTARFAELTKKYDAYIVFGMPEVDASTDLYYNSAALVGPDGYIGKYRKTHQWETEEHWAAWGNLGVPVFATEIGNIAINICMDSAYAESARLAAVAGADILAFPTNSSAQAVSALPARAMQNGLYIVSANRSNTELGFHMVGASAIWSPEGHKLTEAPAVMDKSQDMNETTIVMADIDPKQYLNKNKERLNERRPELYKDLSLFIAPWDYTKSTEPKEVTAAALQYEPVLGDKAANQLKVEKLLQEKSEDVNLVVLPELSLTGPTASAESAQAYAEPENGETSAYMAELAKTYHTTIVYGFVESEGDKLYNTAVLMDADGTVLGKYRKTHLGASDRQWAKAGDTLSVFTSPTLGKIGILIGEDAAFPEAAEVLAVKRADMIAIPSAWNGQFGGGAEISPALSANPYPAGSMPVWDAVAIGAQSYTVVANFTGTEAGYKGRSALYTLDPLYGLDQPVTASADQEQALIVHFTTLQSDWWFNQDMLVLSRRPDYYTPLVMH